MLLASRPPFGLHPVELILGIFGVCAFDVDAAICLIIIVIVIVFVITIVSVIIAF